MRVIIIEDELLAQSRLESLLKKIDPGIEVAARLGSVREARAFLAQHPLHDAAFVDIQLSDDHSFEIFRDMPLQFPLIFTTAYDKYLLESFEHNAIDYLLKPVTEEKLKRSLAKLRNLEQHFIQGNLQKLLQGNSRPQRIVARKGAEHIALRWDEVAYFYTEHKVVFVRDVHGQRHLVDRTLAELETGLDPAIFFRLNRKFLAHVEAIEKFRPEQGKIRVQLRPPVEEEIFVSKETAPAFRSWIGKC